MSSKSNNCKDTGSGRNRKRNVYMSVYLSDEESKHVSEHMKQSGISCRSQYLRQVILDGYVIKPDLSELTRIRRLLGTCANNINQLAKRANETRSIHEADVISLSNEVAKMRNELAAATATLQQLFVKQ